MLSSSKRPGTTEWWNEATSTTTTTPRSTTVIRPVDTLNKQCVNGQYYAYPESCNNFLICVNGNLVIQQCGPGLTWNDEKHMCDWAFNNPCKDKPKKNSPLMIKEKVCTNKILL